MVLQLLDTTKVKGLVSAIVEARVKFHPESDSLRPMSYIQQVLVPNINSSRTVPGVKVEIVSGTLKDWTNETNYGKI